jgi:hypothetical protein
MSMTSQMKPNTPILEPMKDKSSPFDHDDDLNYSGFFWLVIIYIFCYFCVFLCLLFIYVFVSDPIASRFIIAGHNLFLKFCIMLLIGIM